MYHDVVEPGDWDASGFSGGDAAIYKLEHRAFEAHLRAIGRAMDHADLARLANPDELLAGRQANTMVTLHFDDGGASALRVADVLEEHRWRGWFHITTDRIGAAGFVTAADIAELDARGHVIGSHSCSHPARMSQLRWWRVLEEWSRSIETLSQIVGHQVTVASVPGGYSSARVVSAAERAGIRVLFDSEPVRTARNVRDCLVLGRYAVKRRTGAEEAAAIAVGARIPRWRQWGAWNAKKLLKRAGGDHWLAARKLILDRLAAAQAQPAAQADD